MFTPPVIHANDKWEHLGGGRACRLFSLSHLASVRNSPMISPPNFCVAPPRLGCAPAGGCYAHLFEQGKKERGKQEGTATTVEATRRILGSPGYKTKRLDIDTVFR